MNAIRDSLYVLVYKLKLLLKIFATEIFEQVDEVDSFLGCYLWDHRIWNNIQGHVVCAILFAISSILLN